MDRRVYPSFCPGWAYLTTPDMAIKLAEMASNLPPKLLKLKRLDDMFMTGFALEQIPGAKLEQLSGGYSGDLWNDYWSYCPFMGIVKAIFFNDIVLKKGKYVNSKWFLW